MAKRKRNRMNKESVIARAIKEEEVEGLKPTSAIPVDQSQILTASSENIAGASAITAMSRIRYQNDNPIIPSYWSRARDRALINLGLNNDYINTAFINAMFLLMGIEFNLTPLDVTNEEMTEQARIAQIFINDCAFNHLVPFLFDVWSTDNGGFLEILGNSETGETTEELTPIEVSPNIFLPSLGFRHLESLRCTRTGDFEFPIIYSHTNGSDYKLHRSRVYFTQQMKSSNVQLKGIGLCVLSRILSNLTQSKSIEALLVDQTYDGMIGGILAAYPFTGEFLRDLFEEAEVRQSANYPEESRHMKTLLAGSPKAVPQFAYHPFRRLPEGFNKTDEVERMLYIVAATMGLAPRVLWPVKSTTQADAEQSNRQFQQRLPSWFITTYMDLLKSRVLPQTVKVSTTFLDIEALKERDGMHDQLSQTFERDLRNQILSVETVLAIYLQRKILTQQQYEFELERVQNPTVPIPGLTSGVPITGIAQTGSPLFASNEAKDLSYTLEDGRVLDFTQSDIDNAFMNSPDAMRRLILNNGHRS